MAGIVTRCRYCGVQLRDDDGPVFVTLLTANPHCPKSPHDRHRPV